MHYSKYLLLSLALALVGSTARPALAKAADPVLGYVHLQRAILEVEEGKRAKAKLQKTVEQKQKSLLEKEKELKALKEKLEKQSVVKKDDAATRVQKAEFETKVMELQQTFMQEQKELQQLEAKTLSGITKKMKKVIEKIGKSEGYTLILEIQQNRLLFAKGHLDITNQVIRQYNKAHP